jgi:hypothetical protein
LEFPWTLFREALETGRAYLPRLSQAVKESGRLFQEGREGEAVSLFNQLLDGLEWLGVLVDGAEIAAREEPGFLPDGEGVCRAAAAFRSVLKELERALENADYVLLGDLLTYELAPVLTRWEAIVLAADEHLRRSPTAG